MIFTTDTRMCNVWTAGSFFLAIIADCASQPARRGCLMINSMAHFGSRVPDVSAVSLRATNRMERSLADRLSETLEQPAADLSTLNAYLVVVSQGLIQLSHQGASHERPVELAAISAAAVPDRVAA